MLTLLRQELDAFILTNYEVDLRTETWSLDLKRGTLERVEQP